MTEDAKSAAPSGEDPAWAHILLHHLKCCLELAAALMDLGLLYDTAEISSLNFSHLSLSRIWLDCWDVPESSAAEFLGLIRSLPFCCPALRSQNLLLKTINCLHSALRCAALPRGRHRNGSWHSKLGNSHLNFFSLNV